MTIVYADITGQWLAPDGTPLAGTVAKIRANTADGLLRSVATGQVIAYQSRAVTDDDGNLAVSLPELPQAGIDPSDAQWIIEFQGKLQISPVVFTLTGDTTWADVIDVAAVSYTESLVGQLADLVAQMQSYARPAASIDSFSHSYGDTTTLAGASAVPYLYHQLFARRTRGMVTSYGITGARLCGNAATGGFATVLQSVTPSATRNLAYKALPPNLGVALFCIGANDVQDTITNNNANTDLLVPAWKSAIRSVISRCQISALFESTETTYTTLGGSGSWSTTGSTNSNSGTGYSQNSSSGATATLALPSTFLGGTVALGFVVNRVGGTVPASALSFTVDGVATQPIGFPTGLNTQGLWYNDGTHGLFAAGYAVARFTLPPGAHTIVVTAGTGGMSYDCFWQESNPPRPVLWCNIAKMPSSSAYQLAAIDTFNAATRDVLAEFSESTVALIDIDAVMENNPLRFADTTHPNDIGQGLIADAITKAWTAMPVAGPQLTYA